MIQNGCLPFHFWFILNTLEDHIIFWIPTWDCLYQLRILRIILWRLAILFLKWDSLFSVIWWVNIFIKTIVGTYGFKSKFKWVVHELLWRTIFCIYSTCANNNGINYLYLRNKLDKRFGTWVSDWFEQFNNHTYKYTYNLCIILFI